jgi:hypothetical protein
MGIRQERPVAFSSKRTFNAVFEPHGHGDYTKRCAVSLRRLQGLVSTMPVAIPARCFP